MKFPLTRVKENTSHTGKISNHKAYLKEKKTRMANEEEAEKDNFFFFYIAAIVNVKRRIRERA